LSCELLFYLLFPLIIGIVSRRQRLLATACTVAGAMVAVAAACVVVFPTGQLGNLLYTMPAYRLGEFVIGICLATLMKRGWRPKFSMVQAVVVTVAMYAAITAAANVALDSPASLPYFVADLWMLPGFAAIIAAGASGDLRGDGGLVRSTGVVRLGQWSFALYLVHELILKATEPMVDGMGVVAAALALVLAIVLSIAVSGVLYEWFERPVEKRLRSWAMKDKPSIAQVAGRR
jgi:peptidoglycan/LPS O-acetylase OafA/YrhL